MDAIIIKSPLIFKTIQENLVALRGIDYQQLSNEEKVEMRKELLEVREIALGIKIRMEE